MADKEDVRPATVEGEVILDSPVKTLILCLGAIFVFAPLGVGIIYAWWFELSFLDRRIAWYGALIGAVLVLGGVCAVPLSILCFFRRNKLIIGKECLQLVRHQHVSVQIPFKNIARIGKDETEFRGKFIGIDLRDPNESETLCPGAEESKKGFGWHYTLTDESWTLPLDGIHALIMKAAQRNS